MEAPEKLKIELLHQPAVPLLGVEIPKALEVDLKEIFAHTSTAALFSIARRWNGPSVHLWMNQPVTKRQILHDSSSVRYLEKSNRGGE